jgi:tetratricopeptide (TPR) repeat protein
MIHCQKCKTQNDPAQVVCSNCGAELLPARGIGSRLGTLLLLIVACGVLPAIPVYFIFRPETPNPILKWVGYFLIVGAVMGLMYAFYDSFRKTLIHERYAIRARRHVKLDPQQAIADFTKALELVPQKERTPQQPETESAPLLPETERTPLLKERAAIYKDLGMRQEMESDWNEIINLAPETGRVPLLRERAEIHKDLGMMPELESDWDKIIELVPADERVKTLREQAVLYNKLNLVQKFRSPREEILTKMNPNEMTKIDCKNIYALQIPRHVCVYCGSPITKQSKGTIDVSYYGDKAKISYQFHLCDECDEGKNKEVESAVKISDVKEMQVLIAGMVESLSLNFVNPAYAKAFLSANS